MDREQQRGGGKMRTGAKRPAGGTRETMSHRRFTEVFSMGSVNWSYDLGLMEQEIARVRELQRAQRIQQLTKAGNPGHADKKEVDDTLQALIDVKIKAALEGVGQVPCASAERDPSVSTASLTAGDRDQDATLGVGEGGATERPKTSKHRRDRRSM